MTHKHRTTWFLSRLLAILLLLGAKPIWAQPTIPQDLLDMIAEQGSARVIVGLDVPWQPEGLLNQRQVAAQRRDLTATQSQFVETLSQDLADDGLIDSPHSPDGTPTVKAARTFETVPYLVFEVNSITLPYVQNTPKAKTLQLSVPDEPTMSDSLPLIGADKAWDSGHTGAGQAIAIIDTGVDKTHTAFAPARIITEACFSVTHCPNGKPEQTDELGAAQPCEFDPEGCGHGTHVAGIAAGTAPDAQIIAVQAASEFFGKASFYRDDQIAALDWLHTNRESFGVPLAAINMSVGGKKSHSQPCDDDPRTKIIQNLESVGIATIISAGNNGYADGISAPACISKAISVGATDKTGQLWPQSNRADFLDLLAPGVGIESALPGDLTAAKEGTSMAAPHVAGAWAIMKAHNPKASVAEVLAMLKETGQDVEGMPRIQVDAALPQVHAPQGLNDGLVAYYTCDGNANDASGNGNHGTVNGTIEYVEGYIGEAARFRKGYGFIRVPNPTQLFDTQYTISGWLFSEGKGGSVINKYKWGVPGGGKGFGLTSTTEDLSGLASSGSTFFTAALFNEGWNPSKYPKYTMQVGEFKHLTAVYDTGNMKLYIDGILESEKSIQHSNSLDNPYDILIGTYVPPSQTFEGLVDELRIYNRALSESEIKQLYELDSEATLTLTKTGEGEITSTDNSINCGETCEADYEVESTVTLTATPATGYSFTGWSGDCSSTSPTTTVTLDAAKSCAATFEKVVIPARGCDVITEGLVGCYPFEGNANDESGNGNHATAYSGVRYTAGKAGQAVKLSGNTLDYLRIKNPKQKFDNQYSIAAWVSTNGRGQVLLSKYSWNPGMRGFSLFFSTPDGDGRGFSGSTLFLNAGFNNEWWFPSKYPSYTLPINKFQYVSAVYNAGNFKLYVDGILASEKTVQHASTLDNPYDILIGSYFQDNGTRVVASLTGRTFDGLIDELRVYNRALSDSEIKQLYELGFATLTLTKTGEGEITSTTINCGETCEADYEVESTVTLTATPATGSSFTGWSGDCAGASPTTIVTMDAAKSCTAHFDKSSGQKTITINKTGKGRATVKIDISAEDRMHLCKTDCSEMTQPIFTANEIVLTATPAKGFILKQWAGDCSGTDNQITVPMTASKTCTAHFDLDPNLEMYALTVNKVGSQGRLVAKGGIDCGENCTAYYPGGQNVRLEAQFNEADTLFLGWKGDCSGFQNQVYVTMDAAKSCSASFKPYNPAEEFALNVNNGGDGLGTITERVKGDNTSFSCRGKAGCKQSQHQYASGSQVILSAIPETGFEFTGGSGDCAWESDTDNNGRLRGTATVIMDQAKTCTAEFGLKADLTWHKLTFYTVGTGNGSVNNPARIDCGNQCTADYYEAGKTFWLKAEPTALSQFMGWSGDCEGKGSSQKITLDQDKTCIAQFKSDFEILADEMVEAFYATATSSDGTPIGDIYPQLDNQARLKEAFWVTITAILQTDYSLLLSNEQNWPTQFDGINWLPSDSSTQYTDSVQVVAKQFVGIEVELLDQNGSTEKMGIVIYYGEEAPIIDDGVWSRRVVRVAIFSRYAFRRW